MFKRKLHLIPRSASDNTDYEIAPVLPNFIVKAVDVRDDHKQAPGSVAELSMCVKPDIKEGVNHSWRDILITSTPEMDVLVYVLGWSPFYPHVFASSRIKNKKGVTLGQVTDAIADYRRESIGYWYQIRVIQGIQPSKREC